MTAHLTLLDVGHGNAAVLTGPDGSVLIDAGPGPWVGRYLNQQEIRRLDAVAITHSDSDHLKGLVALLDSEQFEVGSVCVNADSDKQSKLWDAVAFSLDQHDRRDDFHYQPSLAQSDALPEVAPGVHLEVLAPSKYLVTKGVGSVDSAGNRLTSNSMSAVIRILVDDAPQVLLAADIDVVGLEHLLRTPDLKTPVLVYPHHGGKVRPSATEQDNADFARRLCEAVQPEIVVFSIGRGRYSTPRPEILAAIRESGARPRIACTQLSESCAAERPPEGAFGHLTELAARGRHQRSSCAGTIRLALNGERMPTDEAHDEFKRRYAPAALCLTA